MNLLPNNAEGYPVFYLTVDCSVLCSDCATKDWHDELGTMETDAPCVHWEGEPVICEDCNKSIDSAYGPVDMFDACNVFEESQETE